MEQVLISSREARVSFWKQIQLHARMRELMLEGRATAKVVEKPEPVFVSGRMNFKPWISALAASLMIVAGGVWISQKAEGKKSAFSLQPSAFVTAVTGECRLQNAACKIGDAILAGMNIKTAKGGVLKFEYAGEKTELVVGEVSSVECRMSGKGEKRLYLSIGQLTATVAKQAPGRPFLVETPLARMTVVGTRFSLQSQLSGTRLDVAEGGVEMAALASGQEIIVDAEHQGLIRPGEYAPKLYGQVLFEDHFDKGLGNWKPLIIEHLGSNYTNDNDLSLRYMTPAETSMVRIVEAPAGGGKHLLMDAFGLGDDKSIALELNKNITNESATMTCNIRNDRVEGDAFGSLQIIFMVPNETEYERQQAPRRNPGQWEKQKEAWSWKRGKNGEAVVSSCFTRDNTMYCEERRRMKAPGTGKLF